MEQNFSKLNIKGRFMKKNVILLFIIIFLQDFISLNAQKIDIAYFASGICDHKYRKGYTDIEIFKISKFQNKMIKNFIKFIETKYKLENVIIGYSDTTRLKQNTEGIIIDGGKKEYLKVTGIMFTFYYNNKHNYNITICFSKLMDLSNINSKKTQIRKLYRTILKGKIDDSLTITQGLIEKPKLVP